MNIYYKEKEGNPYFYLEGEIDHHVTRKIRETIDLKIKEIMPKKIYLDFSKVTFSDSSGIALLIGRYTLMKSLGGEVYVTNLRDNIKRVYSLSGLEKLINFI